MELRTLKYFLTVVQDGNISSAAKRLNVTQPTLSRQLASLEDELGRELYHRTHSGIIPTEYGIMLARYAESITELAEKAEEDISLRSKTIKGNVHIAVGETKAIATLGKAMKLVHQKHPGVQFQMYSGTTSDLMDGLARGRYDFLLECEVQERPGLNSLKLPISDRWGIICRKDDPLAQQEFVTPEDLKDRSLITSRQGTEIGPLHDWFGPYTNLNVVAVYNLGTNCKFLVREGIGIAFVYEDLLVSQNDPDLIFVPLLPHIESHHGLVWRKTLLTRQAQTFLDTVEELLNEESQA